MNISLNIGFIFIGLLMPGLWGADDRADVTLLKQNRGGSGLAQGRRYGELSIGQQNSVYYDVVAAKTDLRDDDMLAQVSGTDISDDDDGSYRPRRQLKFKNSYGSVDLYGAWLFPDSELQLLNAGEHHHFAVM